MSSDLTDDSKVITSIPELSAQPSTPWIAGMNALSINGRIVVISSLIEQHRRKDKPKITPALRQTPHRMY
jgi:hypothetical protein